MNKIITKKNFNKIVSGLYPFLFCTMSHAYLTAKTAQEIQGNLPSLSTEIEKNIEDLELFGLTVDGKNYYGNEIDQISLSAAYPFKNKIAIAPIKQPNLDQYIDIDGDELGYLAIQPPAKITWYYTNSKNKIVEFIPTDSDTFCSLAKGGKFGPYKIKISGDLILTSKYGIPLTNQYPNNRITKHPSKTYTISSDSGICYARPELAPQEAAASIANQWDPNNGFLAQSTVDPTKNFPTTAFYGAQFDLLLAQKGLAKNYDWMLVKGRELVTISNTADVVTVRFNTSQAMNTSMAWQYIMGSSDGYTVIIQGRNKTTGNIIQYPFTITKWFSDWDKTVIGLPKASKGEVDDIVAGCNSLQGKYRISHANELSNAPFGQSAGTAKFTREIGTLLGEWGDPSQEAYPNSWAAKIKGDHDQGKAYQRIWVWDTDVEDYCDYHPYNAKYHCRGETEDKNAVCTAIK
ncbi:MULTISPECIES: hypothetical protein [unclassified Gilliamella]|uniref:hypothetical protein n=1 Tax=unclassified Gilliamella TaxID=2685620 RepID=UPI00080DA9B4|nr:hypothetical protein [Gilliamella apicola]OCG18574.1 hypothetical protein A9G23_10745 [Gilliamella apicola]OCG24401.1 hypothetical protein A9G22_04615 [Gilliamella apicola]